MVYTKSFDLYKLYYVSHHDAVPAQLLLYHGSTFVGWTYFYHDNLALPDHTWAGPDSLFILRFKISEFENIMSILRHEKPLLALYNTETKYGGFGTIDKEPIGEEEPSGSIRLWG